MKDLLEPIGVGIALGWGAVQLSSTVIDAFAIIALAWGIVLGVRMVTNE